MIGFIRSLLQFVADLRHLPGVLRQFAKSQEAAQALRTSAIANGPRTIAEALSFPRVGRRLYPEHLARLVPTSRHEEESLVWLRSITQREEAP